MNQFLEFLETLRGKEVFIQTHNFPDPDAIACAYALGELLKKYEIPTTLCYFGKIDKLTTKKMAQVFEIDMKPYDELTELLTDESKIICVDSQKNGGNILDFTGDEVACIDHHPTYRDVEYDYKDVRITGSCATLIAEYYKKLDVEMSTNVATALLYGLKSDTLSFSRGVTALDIDMFAYLFPMVDQEVLGNLEKNTIEMTDLKAYGAAIENIELYDKTGFASIPFACPDFMIAMVSDFILSLEEVDVAVIYSYRSDGIKFSVRSMTADVHAGSLINNALEGIGNGGGHATMAGGLIPIEAVNQLGQYVDDTIRENFFKAYEKVKNTKEAE